jgi:hypothetical protein
MAVLNQLLICLRTQNHLRLKGVQQFPDSKSAEWIIESMEAIEGDSGLEEDGINWGVLPTDGSVCKEAE